jgi:hypothetical protein
MNYLLYPALAGWLLLPGMLSARTSTYSQVVAADTYVSSGQPNVNFGTQGAMEIAVPTVAQPRTQMSLLRFDTTALQTAFDTDYGVGNWAVTSVSLKLFSSFATAGQQPNNASFNKIATGSFEFDLLSNNNWDETVITWNTLPTLLPAANNSNTLTPLGNFFWTATGQTSTTWTLNPDVNLLQKIANGEAVTLLGQPTVGSTVGYLASSRSVNASTLIVTAEPVPEPTTSTLIASLLCVLGQARFLRRKS